MDKERALMSFDALSQSTRLDALRLLVQAGADGLPAGEIGDRLDVRQNTMSVHLKALAQAGLIHGQRDGRVIRYAADYSAIQALVLYLMQDCCGGRPDLCQPVFEAMSCAC